MSEPIESEVEQETLHNLMFLDGCVDLLSKSQAYTLRKAASTLAMMGNGALVEQLKTQFPSAGIDCIVHEPIIRPVIDLE